jgi:hypothetical protein
MFEDDIPDADTPEGFDPEAVIERWDKIEERGHPFAPDCSVDTDTKHS